MTTRLIVIAACVGVIIAAITIVAVNWPKLPARTLPTNIYVPMGGQAVEVPAKGCLVPILGEIQKRPNWAIRIDDMRWTDYTDTPNDPRHASIVVDASGGTWRDDRLPQQTLPLTDAELRDLMAAFALGCETDESISNHGYEGRYITVAYGKTEPTAARLDSNSPVVLQIGALFDSLRGRYIDNRMDATKQFALKLSGTWRGGPHGEWTKHAIVIDSTTYEVDASAAVNFVDWAMAQPTTLPKGRMVATGTFTLDGTSRPIAVQLDADDTERAIEQIGIAEELRRWMSTNRQ